MGGVLLVAVGKKIDFFRFVSGQSDRGSLVSDSRYAVEIGQSVKRGDFFISRVEQMGDAGEQQPQQQEEKVPNLLVCDSIGGFHLFVFNAGTKRFDFAASQRPIHSPLTSQMLDAQTVAVSNLFGSFCVFRVSEESGSEFEELVSFFAGDTISCIERAKLSPLGRAVIVYGSITGTIGVFALFCSKFAPSKNCVDLDLCLLFKDTAAGEQDAFQ